MTRSAVRLALAFAIAAAALVARTGAAQQGMGPAGPGALARLDRIGGVPPRDHAISVRYRGTLEYEGRLAKPHDTVTYQSDRRITIAGPCRARQDWTTWSDSTRVHLVQSTLMDGGRVWRRESQRDPWVELSGREASDAIWMMWAPVPALTGAWARTRADHGLVAGTNRNDRFRYQWPDTLGQVTVELDAIDEPLVVQLAGVDSRTGNQVRDCRYWGFSTLAGLAWADSVSTTSYPAGGSWRLNEKRGLVDERADLAALTLPDSAIAPAVARADTTPVFAAIAAGVWSVELRDADTRSLVVEFAKDLVLLETSSDGVHGERLRDALAAKFPGKPVRFVSFSHHHPEFAGGLRPFLADSATVVCAGALCDWVGEVARRSFSLGPDRLARLRPRGTTPACDTLVTGRWSRADKTNEVVALDIGPSTHHTDHYLVYWLPRANLLFEGDLGWLPGAGGIVATRRTKGMIEALGAAGIAPLMVVQSRPIEGAAASLSYLQLRALASRAN